MYLASILLITACHQVNTKKMSIGIQPYGSVQASLIDSIKHTIQTVYDFKAVHILPTKPLPKTAYINIKSPRYRADSILKILKTNLADTLDYVIAVTSKDISTTKKDSQGQPLTPKHKYEDWGIFGLGYRPGPACIISTFRIKTTNTSKFIDRVQKICMHEIGHNLGLKHCKQGKKCVMKDAAETIKTIDQVDLELCKTCSSLIQ